jgi:RHS repeat-associated protein
LITSELSTQRVILLQALMLRWQRSCARCFRKVAILVAPCRRSVQDAASCFDQSDPHELPSISCAFTTALLEPASYPVYSVDRYYDPSTGQFLSVDPMVSKTGEAYAYTRDDPVNDTDPSGDDAVQVGVRGGNDFVVYCNAHRAACDQDSPSGWDFALTLISVIPVTDLVGGAADLLRAGQVADDASAAANAAGDAATDSASDSAARRVSLRESTKQAIQNAAPRDANGDFIDPNTGQSVPSDGPFDYGHTPGNEWWRTQQLARAQGWTRQQVIEYENDARRYQIEDPSVNRSRIYEMPR